MAIGINNILYMLNPNVTVINSALITELSLLLKQTPAR